MNNNEQNNSTFIEKLRGWRLGFSIDSENILKGFICAIIMVFFALLQTTLFTKFKPFGAVPDLMLPLTIAVSMTEREKWGAVFGLISAFIIESIGGSTFTILPILYMPTGYICGILTIHYFRDSAATRALYTLVTTALRSIFTLIAISATMGSVTLVSAFTKAVIPEFFACLLFAPLPHLAAKLCLRRFNKSREERTR